MKKDEITIFSNDQFGKVRTVIIDKDPWFVGKDVALSLGYSNTKDAVIRHVDEEDKKRGVAIPDPQGVEQKPVLINEAGVYSLIFSSKMPEAKKFKHWVTSEVLPSLRKKGYYVVPQRNKHKQLDKSLLDFCYKWLSSFGEYYDSVIDIHSRATLTVSSAHTLWQSYARQACDEFLTQLRFDWQRFRECIQLYDNPVFVDQKHKGSKSLKMI